MKLGNGCTLLLGGARSGKSDLAVKLGMAFDGDVVLAATAEAGDDDMADRIARHQAERPTDWGLVESPMLSAAEVASIDADSLLIVDCITLLVSNLLLANTSETQIVEHASILSHALISRSGPTIVISNEVGLGVHPNSELGRQFRDVLGRYNRRIADRAEATLFVAAGRVTTLHELEVGW